LALCDGTYLTALRTGAGTCASIELLARRDARKGALIGAGGQAAFQLEALDVARELEEVAVFCPTETHARTLVEQMQPRLRATLHVATSAKAALTNADVVVAATSSNSPVFDGADLEPGAHVTAIGSITRGMREVDATVIGNSRIFVDSVSEVLREAGELLHGIDAGLTRPEQWTELGAVAAGTAAGRRTDEEWTFYKSVGNAVQDVAIARLAVDLAKQEGRGSWLPARCGS
jgi:ornithine cyclodeaminase